MTWWLAIILALGLICLVFGIVLIGSSGRGDE